MNAATATILLDLSLGFWFHIRNLRRDGNGDWLADIGAGRVAQLLADGSSVVLS